MLYFGCPIWTHDAWFGRLFPASAAKADALYHYSRLFNSIEGNTSFYHLPNEASVLKWRDSVPETFRFTFKFHRSISHDKGLFQVEDEVNLFLQRLTPLQAKIGSLMLQLPASFGPDKLPLLAMFLQQLPPDFRYSVEVRHLGFFDKSDNERALNQLLMQHGIDRVMMDTRALFSYQDPNDTLLTEVQGKKPKVPTHVIATGDCPIIRFVGHRDKERNVSVYRPWLTKLCQWIRDGKTPYLFLHLPDNALAPWFAEEVITALQSVWESTSMKNAGPLPSLTLPNLQQQMGMF